jgi:glycosyltransferase involved in cell wall biosynthesis
VKISFVVPTFNRAATIGAAVQSILRQPYPDREVIVVDDGSTDDTVDVLRRFEGDPSVRLVALPENRGQNAARNAGISFSTGDVVTILDSDDEDLGADLTPIVDILRDRPDLGIVFTGTIARSTGRTMCRTDAAGTTFGHEGFLNGTYRGEYQAFLRRSYLVSPVFEEGLDIKRSCTLLTWLRLGHEFKCTILGLHTRLYGDSRADRLSNVGNVLRDADEVARCFQLVLERYGVQMFGTAPRAYATMVAKRCYYELLAHGRSRAYEVLRGHEASRIGRLTHLGLSGLIALGPHFARAARRWTSGV